MAELRKRGLVTAVICSGPFMKLGQAQARTFGVPDLPLIEIRHPLGGISMDDVKGRAAQALPGLLELVRERMK
ncbi:MAG: hypothetical protein AABZ67_06295 [Pseudomonadota bacterium]